jgi:transposase
MERNIEQRYAIKFCVKLKKSATETFENLTEAYGDATLSRNMVFRWHKAFTEGRENVEDEPRSGRPILSTNDQNVEVVRAVMAKDRRLSVRMIAEETGLDKNAVHRILTNVLHMRKICAKLVPKDLSVEGKENRLEICQDLLRRLVIEPNFLDKVITGDESWMFEYDPETKRQSEEWHTTNSPRPKKARMSRSRVKTMIVVFFDSRGIVHKEFVPPGQTVNQAFYKDVLERLRKRVQRVRRDIADDWVLHHDNAPAHTALSIREFLAKKNIPTLPQPPYSPDLAPCDFYLFPKLKSKLKGHHYGTVENIKKIVTDELSTLTENDFQYCYDQWKKRWNHCVTSQGSYFEGDNL